MLSVCNSSNDLSRHLTLPIRTGPDLDANRFNALTVVATLVRLRLAPAT